MNIYYNLFPPSHPLKYVVCPLMLIPQRSEDVGKHLFPSLSFPDNFDKGNIWKNCVNNLSIWVASVGSKQHFNEKYILNTYLEVSVGVCTKLCCKHSGLPHLCMWRRLVNDIAYENETNLVANKWHLHWCFHCGFNWSVLEVYPSCPCSVIDNNSICKTLQ